jgi:hypothetical protein
MSQTSAGSRCSFGFEKQYDVTARCQDILDLSVFVDQFSEKCATHHHKLTPVLCVSFSEFLSKSSLFQEQVHGVRGTRKVITS